MNISEIARNWNPATYHAISIDQTKEPYHFLLEEEEGKGKGTPIILEKERKGETIPLEEEGKGKGKSIILEEKR